MNPALSSLIIFGLQTAITEAPQLIAELQALFASGTPTLADFEAFRAKVARETYAGFVSASALQSSSDAAAQVAQQNAAAATTQPTVAPGPLL